MIRIARPKTVRVAATALLSFHFYDKFQMARFDSLAIKIAGSVIRIASDSRHLSRLRNRKDDETEREKVLTPDFRSFGPQAKSFDDLNQKNTPKRHFATLAPSQC